MAIRDDLIVAIGGVIAKAAALGYANWHSEYLRRNDAYSAHFRGKLGLDLKAERIHCLARC